MKYPLLAGSRVCVGCLACVDSCKADALRKVKKGDGHLYVTLDPNKCVGCLKCERICVSIQHDEYGNNEKTSVPLATYTTDEQRYAQSTSGGVFPCVASFFIRNGGVVYGAAYADGIHAEHRRIDDIEGLYALQGSKYMQSDLEGVYKKMKEDLQKGLRVLFTGTGCQVAAVLAYFKNNKNKGNLYTMDIVCGGVPSSLLIDSFAQNTQNFSSIVSFRVKDKYVFIYKDTTGKEIICSKALPLDGFKSCLTNRYSCYDCKFVGLHRMSDMTIGDYWGDTSDHARSICIIHSERCAKLFFELKDLKNEHIDWSFAVNNPRIVNGKAPFAKRLERKYIDLIFQRYEYKNIIRIYGSDIRKRDIFWMLYKVYKYVRFMSYFKKSKKIAKQIIEQ